MKTTPEELLLQIISTAAIVTLQGEWHAHATLYAHTTTLDVHVVAADADYSAGGYPSHYRSAHWSHSKKWAGLSANESVERCREELTAQLAWLQGFLAMPATAQEAAA